MAHIVTLKDNNDEISYPITPVDAVFVDNNTTLTDALDDKADADFSNVASGAITGSKIASNTITSSNIDLTTFAASNHLTTTWSLTGTTMTKVMSATVPSTGTYAVMASGGMYSTDHTTGVLRLGKDGVSDANTNQLLTWANTSDRISASISYAISASQGDTIDLYCCSNTAGKNISLRPGFTLTIIRIA